MDGKTYVTTKAECQAKIDSWGNVCDSCGRDLEPIETVDNADNPTFWPGCYHGTRTPEGGGYGNFTNGVPKELYALALKCVLNGQRAYRHMGKGEYRKTPEQREYWFRAQVSGMCSNLREIEWLKTNEPRLTQEQFLSDQNF